VEQSVQDTQHTQLLATRIEDQIRSSESNDFSVTIAHCENLQENHVAPGDHALISTLSHNLYHGDCLSFLQPSAECVLRNSITTIFADPPDNIGAKYGEYIDKIPDKEYAYLLHLWLLVFVRRAKTVWFSYNARWTFEVGCIVSRMLSKVQLEAKQCVQTFTFGQHNHHDLGNNYRPLLRLRHKDSPLLPNAIRVPSWRQENGDKRADPRGRVPGDVFDFPRVTGNSKQRRAWHPTQLNEGLVERCIRLTTPEGGTVLDPFGGTGTTLRVCKRIGRACTLVELDRGYCERIAEEHGLPILEV
jgi:site-specific DNA-methyltransferase (adenine-specific)